MTILDTRKIVGTLAKRRREELGMPRVEFAMHAGVNGSSLYNFEHGVDINGYEASRIERALNWVPGISDRIEYEVNLGLLQALQIEMELLDAEDSPYSG